MCFRIRWIVAGNKPDGYNAEHESAGKANPLDEDAWRYAETLGSDSFSNWPGLQFQAMPLPQ